MKKLSLAIAIIAASSLSGCATIVQGTEDTMSVKVKDAVSRDIECTLNSDDGVWYTEGTLGSVQVERGSSDMTIICENETQEGSTAVESDYQAGWIIGNIFIDFGIVSVPMDLISGAAFDYPRHVTVKMENKIDDSLGAMPTRKLCQLSGEDSEVSDAAIEEIRSRNLTSSEKLVCFGEKVDA
ncbi:hypothetical protein [Vibrio sp. B181a]|uniref:hypothetical protein n=1 Tax=Vibrio sp. B181a TaxID=2835906 RepID=UPI002555A8AE|nr:hypothetical protein [Vibrio sp. B181a]MDK9774692.1 hypothetical protein [Vibrio sp. B181a]